MMMELLIIRENVMLSESYRVMMDEKNWREEELYKLLEKLIRLYHDAENEKLRKLFKDQIQDVESDLGLQDE